MDALIQSRTVTGLHIALVEDHVDLRELFVDFLVAEGHGVAGFDCADDLDDYLPTHHVDLLVLDVNLPGEDGFSIASRLREAHPDLHIVMITARTALEDRIRGYACGADIYLSKPVAPAELGAAVRGIARRIKGQQARRMMIVIDTDRLEVRGPNGSAGLAAAEVLMLRTLAEAPGRRLDYWRLFELLELEVNDKSKNVLEVRISRLKKKLHEVGAPEPAIKSLWKEGYQLCVQIGLPS